MKKITLLLFLLFPVCADGSTQELPRDVREILEKLDAYEAAEKAKLEKNLEEKRAAVAEILRSALDRETKNGNLETAIRIKETISSLSRPELSSALAPTDSTPVDESDFHGEWSWLFETQSLFIEEDGKAFIRMPHGDLQAKWSRDSETSILVSWGKDSSVNRGTIQLKQGNRQAIFSGVNAGKKIEVELVKQ